MKKSLFALALAAALPFAAQAQEKDLSYNWVEGNYVNLDNSTDGWGLRGSYEFGTSGLYGLAGYSWLDADTPLGDVSVKANELGLGYHHSIADQTDLITEVAYRNARGGGVNIDGGRASVGVRSAMTKNFEGFVKANYYDLSDYSGDVSGTVGGQYKFNPNWGVTAEAEVGNGDQAYLLGVRASF